MKRSNILLGIRFLVLFFLGMNLASIGLTLKEVETYIIVTLVVLLMILAKFEGIFLERDKLKEAQE
ncbi:hypothetical protein KY314_05150 [Candidatus Woesearchaeota archaeon]|nr:hypothetical protein [Candidatus Woesearchaeota archaeon]